MLSGSLKQASRQVLQLKPYTTTDIILWTLFNSIQYNPIKMSTIDTLCGIGKSTLRQKCMIPYDIDFSTVFGCPIYLMNFCEEIFNAK